MKVLLHSINIPLQILLVVSVIFSCTQGTAFSSVRLEVKSTIGEPGTMNNALSIQLDNKYESVSRIQFDICDVDNYLTLEDVLITERTKAFDVIHGKELDNGCARVEVDSRSKKVIEKGRGPVLVLHLAVSAKAPLTEHRKITLHNMRIENAEGSSLDVTPVSGALIFVVYQGSIKKVWPRKIKGSRLKSTVHPLLIIGEDTKFNLSSKINFNPRDEVECLWQTGFGNYLFAIIRLPKAPPVGLADVAVFTDGGKSMVNRNDVFEVLYK